MRTLALIAIVAFSAVSAKAVSEQGKITYSFLQKWRNIIEAYHRRPQMMKFGPGWSSAHRPPTKSDMDRWNHNKRKKKPGRTQGKKAKPDKKNHGKRAYQHRTRGRSMTWF